MFGSYVCLVHTIHVTDDFVLNVCLESIFTIYGVLKLPLLVYSLVNKGKIRKKIIYIYTTRKIRTSQNWKSETIKACNIPWVFLGHI